MEPLLLQASTAGFRRAADNDDDYTSENIQSSSL